MTLTWVWGLFNFKDWGSYDIIYHINLEFSFVSIYQWKSRDTRYINLKITIQNLIHFKKHKIMLSLTAKQNVLTTFLEKKKLFYFFATKSTDRHDLPRYRHWTLTSAHRPWRRANNQLQSLVDCASSLLFLRGADASDSTTPLQCTIRQIKSEFKN